MAFGGFHNLGEVALRYSITLRSVPFVTDVPVVADAAFRAQLEFDLANGPVTASETVRIVRPPEATP